MNKDFAKKLLGASGVLFDADDWDDEEPKGKDIINLNDAFFWACSDCEEIADDELEEVGRLFFNYGWNGITYWVCEKRGYDKVEFLDVNRGIEFVRHEEKLIKDEPSDSKRAYTQLEYVLGGES